MFQKQKEEIQSWIGAELAGYVENGKNFKRIDLQWSRQEPPRVGSEIFVGTDRYFVKLIELKAKLLVLTPRAR